MPSLRIDLEGELTDILVLLNRLSGNKLLTEEMNDSTDTNSNDEDKDIPTPVEVLESLRDTFINFAEAEGLDDDRVRSHLKFGADFISKILELKGLDEDEFTLRLFMFAKDYYNEDLPY